MIRKGLGRGAALGFAVALLTGLSGTFAAAGSQEKAEHSGKAPQSVILISWDGVQRAHLKELLDAEKLPNLSAMIRDGGYVDMKVTRHATDTKAGHAEMLTGLPPSLNGVASNRDFNPIPEGATIFGKVEAHFGAENIVTVMLTGKTGNIGGSGPQIRRSKKGARQKGGLRYVPAEPFYVTKNILDVFDSNQADATVVGPKMLRYLEQFAGKRFLCFFHFSDPDHAGHKHGENSDEYSEAVVTCDEWLAKMTGKLEDLGIQGETAIYITSDHGFDEGKKSHKNAPYVWLVSKEPGLRKGEADQADVAPTVLDRFGLKPQDVRPPLQGKSLRASKGY